MLKCFGCGIPSTYGCNFNPLQASDPTGRNFTKTKGDSLVDLDDLHQFSISLPITTKDLNYGQPSARTVVFNSVRCANLTLLDVLGKHAPDLGEYRASQGYRRCPQCRTVNRGIQFCNDECRAKYEEIVGVILDVEIRLTPARPCKSAKKCLRYADRHAAPAKGKSPYCGSACGASDRARAKRALLGVANSP